MKYIIIFLLAFCHFLQVFGQQTDTLYTDTIERTNQAGGDTVEAPVDDEEAQYEEDYHELYYFPDDSIYSMKAKREYEYMKNLDSLLKNLKMDVAEKKDSNQTNWSIFNIKILRVLIWATAIFAVLFILYQLFAGQQNPFYKNRKLTNIEAIEEEYSGEASPLLLSQQAAARADYRQAVRYQYAYILELMGEKKLINLQPQKTNAHYLKEVRNLPLSPDFAKLTLQFEYVWYGGFELNKQQYETISGGYRQYIGTWL
jgi:hypothetical protein